MFKKRLKLIIIPILFFLLSPTALAQNLEERVVEHTLKNGLKILILERHSSPTVATSIIYKVGSSDEEKGYTGIAHLLEHMLFKGTKTLGTKDYKKEKPLLEEIEKVGSTLDEERRKGGGANKEKIKELSGNLKKLQEKHKAFVVRNEFSKIYSKNGAVGYNAWTSVDATNYIINLPSNKLELWASIESDRMKNHVLREYYQERDVVMEERRSRFENNPEGKLYEQLIAASFEKSPYKHPVIGWEEDVKYLPKAKVEAFLDKFYLPNNCIISVVGDIDAKDTIALIEKYFGGVKSGNIPERKVYEGDIDRGEKHEILNLKSNSRIMISYHKPTLPDRDDYVFDVIDSLLTGGRTSRLYKRLVSEDKTVVAINSGTAPGARYENLFIIDIVPKVGHSSKEIIETIEDEIRKLQEVPQTKYELQKVINRLEANMIRAMRANEGIASKLAYYETMAGDWRYMVEHIEKIREISPEDIMNIAKRYLTPKNRTIAEIVKKGTK